MTTSISGSTGINKIQNDAVDIADLSATGTASASTFLRGDNSWTVIDALPTQSGNAGKFLTTDASTASWAEAGGVGQVLQAVVTATIDFTSTTFADVSGITVDITPATTSSKILVMCDTHTSTSVGTRFCLKLVRDSTDIYVGDAAGSRSRSSAGGGLDAGSGLVIWGNTSIYLDSPATTSATTYKLQARVQQHTLYFNRAQGDGNVDRQPRTACSITVMEILA